MLRIAARLAPVFVIFAVAACGKEATSNIPVKTSSADVSIGHKNTYARAVVAPPSGHTTEARSPVVIDKAWDDVNHEMQRRGYTLVSAEKADMIVRITSGTRNVADQPSGGAAAADAPEDVDKLSVLAIEIVDRVTNEPLFRGNATKEVHTNKVDDREVATAVKEIFEKVPERVSTRRR